jgi:hypothetical protein
MFKVMSYSSFRDRDRLEVGSKGRDPAFLGILAGFVKRVFPI